ncbi:hypothetical protein CDD80_7002 [Ophiocordyceps camponoti-rufipedis]|uniref:Aldose 1-epimerase n=1 Tax=Ophiocordyceps camponoti-rufipedis TaxID=2004952 RepID=A0A2C5YN25_9HYPO|nr:hypothetical protein CDD80_7002 [Ophiocordyceps camponoti-rufipedis]
MKWLTLTLSLSLASSVAAAANHDGKYWIHGKGLSAAFVPYGASISNLIFTDQHGVERDLVAGFDNASYYSIDKSHPHLGGVPGRYANRIKNSSFVIDGREYKVAANENPTPGSPKGVNTLHGGPDGWDWRNFSVMAHTENSITFSIVDPAGKEGFPGKVVSLITYALNGRDWDISMVAVATEAKTPIMLSSHTYWNLDGFSNDATRTALNHSLHLPYSGQRIGVDGILVPTGEILANAPGSVNDFWTRPRQIGSAFGDKALVGNCGSGCTGYDNCFTINRGPHGSFDWLDKPVATLSSAWSGIQLDVFTDQDAMQLYSCNGQNGTLPLKYFQGTTDWPRTIEKYGCVVLEVQDYIDGINHPEWMRKQVFGPSDGPYVLNAKYRFSLTWWHDQASDK